MTLLDDRSRRERRTPSRDLGAWVIPLAVIAVIALRLPLVNRPPTPDEAGYLMVGAQWDADGTSLYGDFWVDRPPLLVGIFHVVSMLGGLPALRIIGCLAAGMTVLASATASGLIAGRRAARWTAVAAAALLASPLLGTVAVNGELLASPFIAWSIAATVAALRSDRARPRLLLAVTAGAVAMAALLIKQNLADAFVFGLVAIVLARRRNEIDGRDSARLLVAGLGGAAITASGVALMSSLHGTPLGGALLAIYPFRLEAGHVMAGAGRQYASPRLVILLLAFAVSGLAVLFVVVARGAFRRRLQDAASSGLMATAAFGAVSVAAGGNYWTHYLVEPIAPIAMLSGILVARNQRLVRLVISTIAVVSVASLAIWLAIRPPSEATEIARSIARSADPDDTIVVAYGHADLVHGSGLRSPYRYLWSLPIRTLDSDLKELNRVLTGPDAPTWFVAWGRVKSWGINSASVENTLRRDFRKVDRICGHTIYLHNSATRPQLRHRITCPTNTHLEEVVRENLP